MLIKSTDEEAIYWRVFFDGRLTPYCLAANDTEGWIEIIDTAWLKEVSNIDTITPNDPGDEHPEGLSMLGTKRVYGKVRLEKIILKTDEKKQ